jgi:hypothetical protein
MEVFHVSGIDTFFLFATPQVKVQKWAFERYAGRNLT